MAASSAVAAAAIAGKAPAMAGPFARTDFDQLVPADKKLNADWVRSLFERGTPEVYRGDELKWIGMPIGGLCCGQLYLGGDGKLWHWDIFNKHAATGAGHYANPMTPASPFEQSFSLTIGDKSRALDKTGFAEITFRGEYPIATVDYRDPAAPVAVTLEAFSPFIPLETDDSSLPATIMRFTVKNTSKAVVEASLDGTIENAVCLHHRHVPGRRRNRGLRIGQGFTFLECSAVKSDAPEKPKRPDVVFEDWSKPGYEGWKVEGQAFGSGPIEKKKIPEYQGDVGGDTPRVVNSHATAPGTGVGGKDGATGKLTSRPFKIERKFLRLWIGGGSHKGKTCVNLLVDGKVAASLTGQNNNRMSLQHFDVAKFEGREAVLEIVDDQRGPWGNIGVGKITQTDQIDEPVEFDKLHDFGTMGLALLEDPTSAKSPEKPTEIDAPLSERLVSGLSRKVSIAPGGSATITFLVTWHFPNLSMPKLPEGRYYASRFDSALDVATYVVKNFDRLVSQTRLWRDTWYDSTLPYWFLDRTMLNTSILASSTSFRFKNGRFYGWEGVGCCAGTCGHVWHYAHSPARLFPDLERDLRERVDFGLALKPDGAILFRGEHNNIPAIDAQAGSILRAYREHQMSADDQFLKRIWPGVKLATEWLIAKDANGDGLIESNQHNTLDADWFGPIAWLSGLYLASLRAAEAMANELGDVDFAKRCRAIFDKGMPNLIAQLYDGEYFINKPDLKHLDAINSGTGCEIDQVMGQSWAWQVGLGRVFPGKETLSALKSLWRYNFTPDVGPYRKQNKAGRWYAMPGEAGLLMCTFPRTDWSLEKAAGKGNPTFVGYFNECMNGFEYQAAGNMIWEGMLLEGLAVTRAVHDRYHPSRRNPWNEVECGDHYARSMASYGVYLAACGFECHGPKGQIGFLPRLSPEKFKAAFTAAEGWGSFSQQRAGGKLDAEIKLKHGKLQLKQLGLAWEKDAKPPKKVAVSLAGKPVDCHHSAAEGRLTVEFAAPITIQAGESLAIVVS